MSDPDYIDPRWPGIGQFNFLEALVGARGSGKSTYACQRALELQRQTGAYVIGHSIGQRMPRSLPPSVYGGMSLPLEYHRSTTALDRGLRRHPERWHVVGPPLAEEDPTPNLERSSADDVLRYAIRLSYSLREQAWLRAHPFRLWMPKKGVNFDGLRSPPIIVVIDEGIAVTGAAGGARAKGASTDWFNELLISLRHLHIGIIYSIQSATLRSWHLLEQATAIHVYQIRHQWAINAIQAAGASEDEIARIETLPRFERVTLSPEAR
jgi:hypothetical protein